MREGQLLPVLLQYAMPNLVDLRSAQLGNQVPGYQVPDEKLGTLYSPWIYLLLKFKRHFQASFILPSLEQVRICYP